MTKKTVLAVATALLGLMPQAFAAGGTCFADFAATRGYSLGRPSGAVPTPDGKAVIYLKSGPRDSDQLLYEFDIASRQERELITPEQVLGGKTEQLSAEEKARRERERVSAHGFVWFQLSPDGKAVLVSQGGKLFVVERADAKVTALPGTDWIAPKFSPDGKKVAALKDDDIHVIDIAAGSDTQITTGASDALTHGEAEFVAQEEMDRADGFWWSPDSKSIAYEEADLSPVEVHYIADPLHPEEKPVAFRYPRAGGANAVVRLGVIAAGGGKTVWVPWDNANSAYPYLVRLTWDKGAPLTLVIENRALTEEKILAADAATGKTKLLWTERDAAWLELPQADFPRWLSDGSGFLWASERSGRWQLERHARDGKLINDITPKGFLFDHLADLDFKTASVVAVGGSDRLSLQVWRLPLRGGKPLPLAVARGESDAAFGLQHAMFVHSYNFADGTAGTDIRNRSGALIATLPSSAETPPFIPKVEFMTVGPLGFDALVIRPRDFDAQEALSGDPVGICRARRQRSDGRAAPLLRRPMHGRSGLHRRHARQSRHAGARPRLAARGERRRHRHSAAGPGRRIESHRRARTTNGSKARGCGRLVLRRLFRGDGDDAQARRLRGRRRRRAGGAMGGLRHLLHRALHAGPDRQRRGL